MTPKAIYQQHLEQQQYENDPAQANAVEFLDNLFHRLTHKQQNQSFLKSIFSKEKNQPETGLYLYGGVGRGKTWLMDLFYDALPFENKLRLHFFHFMQAVHDELTLLKGHQDPLILVAKNFAKQTQILCLDEFHVDDITDAMLLYGLLDNLFKEGVCLVATSNIEPDELYKHGLQRDRFVPAINLIKKHTQTVNVNGEIDHRLRLLEKAETWYITVDDATNDVIKSRFKQLAPCEGTDNEVLHIHYRDIPTIIRADDVVWFDFNALCDGPRAASDYIEIARQFHTVFITDIPELNESIDDKARRFINLIDEFYDRNVKLIISANTLPQDIYTGKQLAFEFQRTISRLIEMRSHDYMSRAHKP